MTLLVVVGALLAILALRFALEHSSRSVVSSPGRVALALLTLAALTVLPLAFAACLAEQAVRHSLASPLGAAAGASAITITVVVLARAVFALRRARLADMNAGVAAECWPENRELHATFVPSRQPAAFVARDRIVVTTGMRDRLSPEQLGAVVAHERAHIDGRHPRLIRWAAALRAGAPWPANARSAELALRHHLECLADRDAMHAVGDPDHLANALAVNGPVGASAPRRAAALRPTLSRRGRARVGGTIAAAAAIFFLATCYAVHLPWLGLVICGATGLFLWLLLRPLRVHRHDATTKLS